MSIIKLSDRQRAQMERLRRQFPGADETTLRLNVMTDAQKAIHWGLEGLMVGALMVLVLGALFIILSA